MYQPPILIGWQVQMVVRGLAARGERFSPKELLIWKRGTMGGVCERVLCVCKPPVLAWWVEKVDLSVIPCEQENSAFICCSIVNFSVQKWRVSCHPPASLWSLPSTVSLKHAFFKIYYFLLCIWASCVQLPSLSAQPQIRFPRNQMASGAQALGNRPSHHSLMVLACRALLPRCFTRGSKCLPPFYKWGRIAGVICPGYPAGLWHSQEWNLWPPSTVSGHSSRLSKWE